MDLYCKGDAGKKRRYQPSIIRRYTDVINIMISVDNVLGLFKYKSLRYEKMSGNKDGISSVRVNDQYRIEFTEDYEDGQTVASICNIIELSNHYKK